MFKRVFSIFVILIIVSLLSISVFAADEAKSDTKSEPDQSKLKITITKPNSDGEMVFKKEYTICGITDINTENIRIELFKRNSDGSFNNFKGANGESTWNVGKSGFFSIDVLLSSGYKNNSGLNKFMIKAYDMTKPENNSICYVTVKFVDQNKLKADSSAKEYSLNNYFSH